MKSLMSFVYIGIAAFLLIGPFPRQVLKVRAWPIPGWVMFAGKSLDVCVGEFSQGHGKNQISVRAESLAKGAKGISPKSIGSFVSRLCSQGEYTGAQQLHAELKCASRKRGWNTLVSKENPLCSPSGQKAFKSNLAKIVKR